MGGLPLAVSQKSVPHGRSQNAVAQTEVFPKGFFTFGTGLKDGTFHLKMAPTLAKFDKLAQRIVLNDHAFKMREQIRIFLSVVTCELGELFSAHNIQGILSGSFDIDVNDWEKNMVYPNGSDNHPVMIARRDATFLRICDRTADSSVGWFLRASSR